MGVFFFSSFYLQLVRGYAPLQTGLLFLPFAVAQLIFAPRSAAMVKRFGAKAVATTGLVLVTLSLVGVRLRRRDHTDLGVLRADVLRPGRRDGQRHAAGDRVDHVGAAAGEGRRRLGGQQHDPAGRRRARRRGARLGRSRRSTASRSTPSTAGLPEPARDAANESISGAYGVAERLGAAGQPLVHAANDAFVTAMHWAAGARA